MQGYNNTFLEILKVPLAELWLVKNNLPICKSRGTLEVFYSKTLKLILFRVDDFKIILEKSLEVIGSTNCHDKSHVYIFPHYDGFHILRILHSKPDVLITNLETILDYNTTFVRKSGLEHKLESYTRAKDSGQAFSKAFTIAHDSHPNLRLVRTYEELIDVESPGVRVIDVPADEVQNLRDEYEEIVRNHLETKLWKEFTNWGGISGTNVSSTETMAGGTDSVTGLGSKIDEVMVGRKKLDVPEPDISLGNQAVDFSQTYGQS